jgi:hypothetical protein
VDGALVKFKNPMIKLKERLLKIRYLLKICSWKIRLQRIYGKLRIKQLMKENHLLKLSSDPQIENEKINRGYQIFKLEKNNEDRLYMYSGCFYLVELFF